MSSDQFHFEFPGAAKELPDADLRKKREAVVLEHTMAEMVWDIDGVLATFPRGGVYRVLPFEESPLLGEKAIKGYFDEIRQAFPDLEHEIHVTYHTSDALVMEASIKGTQAAEWRGIPSKGKSIDAPVAVFFHFDGDVLIDETIYFDLETLRRQLG
jgi:steroid delta-isomerase-like uncharacterized protein